MYFPDIYINFNDLGFVQPVGSRLMPRLPVTSKTREHHEHVSLPRFELPTAGGVTTSAKIAWHAKNGEESGAREPRTLRHPLRCCLLFLDGTNLATSRSTWGRIRRLNVTNEESRTYGDPVTAARLVPCVVERFTKGGHEDHAVGEGVESRIW